MDQAHQTHMLYIWSTTRIHSGPTSFLIYIDDLTHLPTSEGSHSVLYADDLLLFFTIKGQEDFQLLQDGILSIDKWVQQNYLTLNSAKYKYMVMSRKRRSTHPGVLYLGDTPLEPVECCKYLGVILAGDLSSSQHRLCLLKSQKGSWSSASKILQICQQRHLCPIVPLTG